MSYESVRRIALMCNSRPGADPEDLETWRVEKIKMEVQADHSTIVQLAYTIWHSRQAERYLLSSSTPPLGWIIDRTASPRQSVRVRQRPQRLVRRAREPHHRRLKRRTKNEPRLAGC